MKKQAKLKSSSFYSLEKDGVTQGLLAMWQACRYKARFFLQGWSGKTVSMGLTYGSIGHGVLEKAYTDVLNKDLTAVPSKERIRMYVQSVERLWRNDNLRVDQKTLEYLELSLLIAEATLPIYFDYWKKDFKKVKWQTIEGGFNIPYQIKHGRHQGRTIPVRGKQDGVFLLGKSMWLNENKFMSIIREDELVDTLPLNFQINLYLWALVQMSKKFPTGVLYNIVRRSCLRRGKHESLQAFSTRIVEDIKNRPEFYFIRMELEFSKKEIENFELELEDMLSDFIDWWEGRAGHYRRSSECVTKYGRCNYLPLCASNQTSFYIKRKKVFRELQDY